MFDYKSNNVKHFVESVVFRVIYMQQVEISNMTRVTRNYDEGSLDPIIQTYRPWTNRRTSGWINKKIWRESEANRNFGE